jgi:hypothetical protein
MTVAEIKALSPPQPLAGHFLYHKTVAVLVAPSGSGKSFLGLDLGASIATGEPFLNQPTMQGRVVYVAAEGGSFLKYRLAAWEKARDLSLEDAPFQIEVDPLNLLDADSVAYFISMVKNMSPEPTALVVIDTLARCMGGGDENSTQDMSLAVTSLDAIRMALGCSVLVVHHCGWDARHERGSTALRGAADVVLRLHSEQEWTAEDGRSCRQFRLTCQAEDGGKPHRDGKPFENQSIRLVPIEVTTATTSCHIELGNAEQSSSTSKLGNNQLRLLQTLAQGPDRLTTTEWRKLMGLPESSFYKARKWLLQHGYIDDNNRPIRTAEGTPLHSTSTSPGASGAGLSTPLHSTPPKGVEYGVDLESSVLDQKETPSQERAPSQERSPSRRKPIPLPDPDVVECEPAAVGA